MTQQNSLGVINHDKTNRGTDYLYRVSIKSLIRNEKGEVLVVKETGRDWWDLPGGGMDHGEDLRAAIAREMKEEVSLEGDFTYKVISVDEPVYLRNHDFWQVRLIFELNPTTIEFSPGVDADEVEFIHPEKFKDSPLEAERHIYAYATIHS